MRQDTTGQWIALFGIRLVVGVICLGKEGLAGSDAPVDNKQRVTSASGVPRAMHIQPGAVTLDSWVPLQGWDLVSLLDTASPSREIWYCCPEILVPAGLEPLKMTDSSDPEKGLEWLVAHNGLQLEQAACLDDLLDAPALDGTRGVVQDRRNNKPDGTVQRPKVLVDAARGRVYVRSRNRPENLSLARTGRSGNRSGPKAAMDQGGCSTWPLWRRGISTEERVALVLEEPAGVRQDPVAVVCGIPLPAGHVILPGEVGMSDAQGRRIPVQNRVLQQWGDGSIQWLALQFLTELNPCEKKPLVLTYGGNKERAESGVPIARLQEKRVVVETGRLSFTIKPERAAFLENLRCDGKDLSISGILQKVELEDMSGKRIRARVVLPLEVELEHAGPLVATIRVTGLLEDPQNSGRRPFYFCFRIQAWKDQTWLQIDHTFINMSGEDNGQKALPDRGRYDVSYWNILEWALEFSTKMSGPLHYQCPLGAGPSVVRQQEPATLLATSPIRVLPDGTRLFHDPRCFLLPRDMTDKNAMTNVDEKVRVPGWMALWGEAGGMSLSAKEFWQNCPMKIAAGAQGMTLGLWANESGEKFHCSEGMAKRHRFLVRFYAPRECPPSDSLCQQMTMALQKTPLALPDPGYLTKTRALGNFTPADPVRFPDEHKGFHRLDQLVEMECMKKREHEGWYGMRDFGCNYGASKDNILPFQGANLKFGYGTGRMKGAWGNWHDESSGGLLLESLRRGGYRPFFEEAERQIWHRMDIGLCHFSAETNRIGGPYCHSENHVGMQDGGHAWNAAFYRYYQLTGGSWARECALKIADWAAGSQVRCRPNIGGVARDDGRLLMCVLAAYQLSWDPKYLSAARHYVNNAVAGQQTYGPGYVAKPNPELNAVLSASLFHYYMLTGDKRAADCVEKSAQWARHIGYRYPFLGQFVYYLNSPKGEHPIPGQHQVPMAEAMMAFALGKDTQFLDFAEQLYDLQPYTGLRNMQHFVWTEAGLSLYRHLILKTSPFHYPRYNRAMVVKRGTTEAVTLVVAGTEENSDNVRIGWSNLPVKVSSQPVEVGAEFGKALKPATLEMRLITAPEAEPGEYVPKLVIKTPLRKRLLDYPLKIVP